MLKKILVISAVVLVIFCAWVVHRPSTFRYERRGLIEAPAEKIFPYLNNFKSGGAWSPYEKSDLNMKKIYSGPEAGIGAKMAFAGGRNTGSGELEILQSEPNRRVQIRLTMTRPLAGVNIVEYRLDPAPGGSLFSWTMTGSANFFSKLVGVFIDCEKMVGDQMSLGIQNLKMVATAQ